MSRWIQVTLDYDHPATSDPAMSLSPGAVHYRVHASKEDDWSGWAESEEEALRAVKRLRKKIETERT